MKIIKLLILLICTQSYAQDKLIIDPVTTSINDLNINTKTIYNKQVNTRALTFLTGATMTTIGVVNILNGKSFDHKSVRNTIPLDPHRLLIGVGLFTITISITIPL
jgi:hypothetical protein